VDVIIVVNSHQKIKKIGKKYIYRYIYILNIPFGILIKENCEIYRK
jgi:hypothetical protein